MTAKIVSIGALAEAAAALRADQRKLVLTNGCFDLLHVGHVRYLQAARELGDALAVALNGDGSVRALKGPGRPVNTEADRAEVLAALSSVDYITIFSEVRATAVIEAVRPAVYVKGGDYKPETLNSEERDVLDRVGAEIRILPFEQGYSTTRLLSQLSKSDT